MTGALREPRARETRARRRGPGSRTATHRRVLYQAVKLGTLGPWSLAMCSTTSEGLPK